MAGGLFVRGVVELALVPKEAVGLPCATKPELIGTETKAPDLFYPVPFHPVPADERLFK